MSVLYDMTVWMLPLTMAVGHHRILLLVSSCHLGSSRWPQPILPVPCVSEELAVACPPLSWPFHSSRCGELPSPPGTKDHLFPPPASSCLYIFLGYRGVDGWWWGRQIDREVVVVGGTLLTLGLPAGARWPSLSLGDLWEGHYEVWVAVTLTACDSTTPGTAVPACPSQRPRACRERGGREAALEKAQARVGFSMSVWGGARGWE